MADSKQPKFSFNYKDLLALIGLGLLGWGLKRLGGLTALALYGSFICLAWSGLLHVVVKYVEFHIVNSVRLMFHKLDGMPANPLSEK
jgi:hypothetical protein